MQVREFFDSDEKLAIHISTFCEYIKVAYLFDLCGFKYRSGDKYLGDLEGWKLYKCGLYLLNKNAYCNYETIKDKEYNVIEAKDFLKEIKTHDTFYNKLVKIIEDDNLYHITSLTDFKNFCNKYDSLKLFNIKYEELGEHTACIHNFQLVNINDIDKSSYNKVFKLNFDDTESTELDDIFTGESIRSIPSDIPYEIGHYLDSTGDSLTSTTTGGYLKKYVDVYKPVTLSWDGEKTFTLTKGVELPYDIFEEKPFWIDSKGVEYTRSEMDDKHLRNTALWLLKEKREHKHLKITLEVLKDIYNECARRNIFELDTCYHFLKEAVKLYGFEDEYRKIMEDYDKKDS